MGSTFNINTIVDQYIWPLFMIAVFGTALGMFIKNFKTLTGNDGESRKEALIDIAWMVAYVVAGMAALTAILVAIKAAKPNW